MSKRSSENLFAVFRRRRLRFLIVICGMMIGKCVRSDTILSADNIKKRALKFFLSCWAFWLRAALERQTPEAMKIFWVSFIWTWMHQTSVTGSILRRWPYRVMARLTGIDAAEKLEKQRFIFLLEPCCGSGANLLAFAEHIADSGKFRLCIWRRLWWI